jgi:hypothetical protein
MANHTMNSAEMSEAGMTDRSRQENRAIETVKTVFHAHWFLPGTTLKRGVNEKNFEKFASGFFEEKSRGEVHKTKPTKANRKDAQAAKRT